MKKDSTKGERLREKKSRGAWRGEKTRMKTQGNKMLEEKGDWTSLVGFDGFASDWDVAHQDEALRKAGYP